MLAAVRETGGEVLVVQDEELPPVLREFARKGVLMEPRSAIPFAGLAQLSSRGNFSDLSMVVVPVTGHGLKATGQLKKLLNR